MRESQIEKYLVQKVVEAGGVTRKLKWQGRNDAPDRYVLINGITVLVEVKSLGLVPRASQQSEFKKLKRSGAVVQVVDCFSDVDALIESITL